MNESRAFSFVIYPLKVDDKLIGIMFGIGENLGAEEPDDMIRDDFWGFVLEICIIYTEMRVEPVNFVGYEFPGYEALLERNNQCFANI